MKCAMCDKEALISAKVTKGRKRKTCSEECRMAFLRERNRERLGTTSRECILRGPGQAVEVWLKRRHRIPLTQEETAIGLWLAGLTKRPMSREGIRAIERRALAKIRACIEQDRAERVKVPA